MDLPPPIEPPARTLMGPGPSDVHPRVLRAMSTPLLGHLDGAFLDLMDEVQEMLRYTFRTDNPLTIPISGTGSAAMEAAIANVIEPGQTALLPGNGYFGERMASMARRAGAEVVVLETPWGDPLDSDAVSDAMAEHEPDVFGFVHVETSTGVLQRDVAKLVAVAHDHDALVIADTVASLGGVEFLVDEWDVDVVYSGAQKCLSCPPGVSPITVSPATLERLHARESPVQSWYLDLTLIEDYWGEERSYHHTAPISNVYSLHEALRPVVEEGIEARWRRHEAIAAAMVAGLEAMGLERLVDEAHWAPTLTTVRVPEGIDPDAVIGALMADYDIEIAGGLGALAGEILRIGCMGYSARPANVAELVMALGSVLTRAGADLDVPAGLEATRRGLDDVARSA